MAHVKPLTLGIGIAAVCLFAVAVWAIEQAPEREAKSPAAQTNFDQQIQVNAQRLLKEGKQICVPCLASFRQPSA